MHHEIRSRNLDKNPDEVRKFTHGRVELASLGEVAIGRITLEPGWKWSNDVKQIVNTNSCELPHTQYAISGRLRVRMDDGTEQEFGPGDAMYVPPGHDAWVVGNEPFVAVDFTGMKEYAAQTAPKK
ncbi:MAG: cupin domain-containing protein [Thermoproteota archaeon]|nr:cupin domain-containing protein [Thermoproteota archaeon]